ncbi:MAG TPA: 30S ribosome-binding factor RbfA [Candidatus Parcubacteria bacterium]|jgi:ribosome-binding factor A|nr:30S ribosome-binding factor RbfA [Candidatus Parcubacteria bacterium]
MNRRIQRINELIKRELSQFVLRELDFPKNILITITRVETSVDLSRAKVYISTMPEDTVKKVLKILNNQVYDFQQKINKRLNMRPVPQIKFLEEKKTREAGIIEELLEKVHKKDA